LGGLSRYIDNQTGIIDKDQAAYWWSLSANDKDEIKMKYAVVNASASGSNTIVAAVPNKRIRVLSYVIIAAGAVTVTWRSVDDSQGSLTAISGPMALAANGVIFPSAGQLVPAGLIGQFETNRGETLALNLGAAVSVAGHITYTVTD
jgi:hypothetical protein